MEVKIPLRVPPPPCRGDRDEDPTDVPRPDVDVQSDLGAVAFRAESVRVPDVRARIPCGNGIAVRRIEGHVLIDRHRGGSCGSVTQPDFIPAPPEDETCASSGRGRVLVVVLSEVGPPGEHRVAREGDHAIQGESHPLQATAAMSHEPRELTLFKVDLVDGEPVGRCWSLRRRRGRGRRGICPGPLPAADRGGLHERSEREHAKAGEGRGDWGDAEQRSDERHDGGPDPVAPERKGEPHDDQDDPDDHAGFAGKERQRRRHVRDDSGRTINKQRGRSPFAHRPIDYPRPKMSSARFAISRTVPSSTTRGPRTCSRMLRLSYSRTSITVGIRIASPMTATVLNGSFAMMFSHIFLSGTPARAASTSDGSLRDMTRRFGSRLRTSSASQLRRWSTRASISENFRGFRPTRLDAL